MHIFGAAGTRPGVLRPEHIHRLTVDSRGSKEVREAVKRFGGRDSKSVVTILVSHTNGKIVGSKWMVLGGAGAPELKVSELTGGDGEWKLKLNLTDLSGFNFNGNGARANFSSWVEGKSLVTKMKKRGEEELTDKKDIEEKLEELKVNFVGRLAVVPLGSNDMGVCFMVAPVGMEEMKKKCLEKSCIENSARIPVKEIKISAKKGDAIHKTVSFLPWEGKWRDGPKGWVLFPLLERSVEGSSDRGDVEPCSEDIRRECFNRLRSVFLPAATKEVWRFYDKIGQAGEKITRREGILQLSLSGEVLKGENWAEGEREPKERWPEFVLVTDGDSDASEGKH